MYNTIQDAAYGEKASQASYVQGQIGSAVNAAPQPRQPTVTEAVLQRLDVIHRLLTDTLERKQMFLERLHGPRPSDPEAH